MSKSSPALDWRGASLLGLFVLLSRLPFLTRNYGYDGDAWSVARAAREIATQHQYVNSRLPGFPLQEISYAAVWRLGPLATNGLTAFFSAVAAVFFYLTCRELGLRRNLAVLAAVALAFTPIVYVNSTVTLDYVWGLAFLMGGLYAACRGNAAWAGVAVGLAMGCRLSSAMMVVPLAIFLPRRQYPAFAGLAAIVGALCYVPPFLSYGISFFRFADEPISWEVRARLLGYGATLGLWGASGVVGLLLALIGFAWRRPKVDRGLVAASLIAILLGVVLFARVPFEYAYMIPIVPFAILLIAVASPEPVARIALVLIIASPFVGEEAALFKDARLKREQLDSIEHYAAIVDNVKPDIFETGPEIDRFLAQEPHVATVKSLSPEERVQRLDAGEVIYVLHKQGHVYSYGAKLSANAIEVDPSSGIRDQMLLAQLVPRPSAREKLFAGLTQLRLFMAGTKTTVEDGGVLRERFGPTLVQINGRTYLPLFTTKERARVFAAADSVVAPVAGSELPALFTGIAEIVLDPGTPSQCMVSLTEYQAFLTK